MRVVFDMDGTLADNSAREHLARAAAGSFGSKNEKSEAWEKFHAGIPNDTAIVPVWATLVALHRDNHHIEIWTARPEQYRVVTLDWMRKYDIHHRVQLVRMRPNNVWMRSCDLKAQWFRETPVDLVFEDHPDTVAALRALGCTVAQVGTQTGV